MEYIRNKEKLKIIVAHPAQQHSYRTASALNREGLLFKYVTTYYHKEKSILNKFVQIFLNEKNRKRAVNRRVDDIDDSQVMQFYRIRGLIELFLSRVNKRLYLKWSENTTNKFGIKLAKYAIKRKVDAVILYDTKAYSCFKYLEKKKSKIKRILDMSAPVVKSMNHILYSTYKEFTDDASKNIERFMIDKKIEHRANRELKYADHFIVASKFTENTLIENGVNENLISSCPYGIDHHILNNKARKSNSIKFIYVGRISRLKGVNYLLSALEGLDKSKFSLTLVGDYGAEYDLYDKYSNMFNFLGHVTKDELKDIYIEHDIMIFPSLADGFGLVVLEAMSKGLPVICSQNAGANDLVKNYYNGFVFTPNSEVQIIKHVNYFIENPDEVTRMSQNAIECAAQNPWSKYENILCNIVKQVCHEQK